METLEHFTWGELNQLAAAVALLSHVVAGGSLPEILQNSEKYILTLGKLEDKLAHLMVSS